MITKSSQSARMLFSKIRKVIVESKLADTVTLSTHTHILSQAHADAGFGMSCADKSGARGAATVAHRQGDMQAFRGLPHNCAHSNVLGEPDVRDADAQQRTCHDAEEEAQGNSLANKGQGAEVHV